MYYVIRQGQPIENYHARFNEQKPAREYAMNLKASFRHEYNIVRVETVFTTQTLNEAMKEETP